MKRSTHIPGSLSTSFPVTPFKTADYYLSSETVLHTRLYIVVLSIFKTPVFNKYCSDDCKLSIK